MEKRLEGKRLLVLGGNSWANVIRNYTSQNGIVMIAAGNNPKTALFYLADECYNVNSTDSAEMIKLIKEKKVDGVYLGGNEPVISVACEYIRECGLPCYCKKDTWDSLQNKESFKRCCIEAGLPVVPQFFVDADNIFLPDDCFPVITKPVDGCGSNGFSVCNNNAELILGYKKASVNSITGKVLVEKFVKNQGNVVFYTVSEGKLFFSGMSDKYPVRFSKQGSYVGGLFVYESLFEDEFRGRFENKLQKMIDTIGIKEGTFWIEVFHDGDNYYFNESGYRYGGSVSIYPVDYLYGINQVASDIYYALTGESKVLGHKTLFDKEIVHKAHYAIYPVYVTPGTITSFEGFSKLSNHKNIAVVLKAKEIGCVINDTGSFGQAAVLVHVVFDTYQELQEIIDYIHSTLCIYNQEKNNMIIKMIDMEKVYISEERKK